MLDVPLLRKAVEWAEEQDKLPAKKRTWFQGSWSRREKVDGPVDDARIYAHENIEEHERNYCGTNMCIAGKIAQLTGWEPEYVWNGIGAFVYASFASKDGVSKDIADIARDELGVETLLDSSACHMLFHGDNGVVEIRKAAELLAGERL